MSLDSLTKLVRSAKSPTDRVDLMAQELVHEDFAFSQMGGNQEKAVTGEDSPQFSERSAEFISSQMLDRVEGDGTGERSGCEGQVADVPAHCARAKTGGSQPDHRNGQINTEDLGPSIRQVSTYLSWTATDVEHVPTSFDPSHEGVERCPVNGQPIEVARKGLGVLMGNGAIGGSDDVRTERLHRESFPWDSTLR